MFENSPRSLSCQLALCAPVELTATHCVKFSLFNPRSVKTKTKRTGLNPTCKSTAIVDFVLDNDLDMLALTETTRVDLWRNLESFGALLETSGFIDTPTTIITNTENGSLENFE